MIYKPVIFIILTLSVCSLVSAKTMTGQVIKVSDGDTIIIETQKNKKIKIRLAEIDAPEMAQPYGKKSQHVLSALILSKIVLIDYENKDQYQRIVGRVYLHDQDICAKMVSGGHAWVYRQYSNDMYLYFLEYWARFNNKGLWALPLDSRTPPWEWRRGHAKKFKSKTISFSSF